jgi:hypothetical protein
VRYTRYLRNFFDAGFLQPLQTAHIFQQHLSAFGSDPSMVSSVLVLFTFARFLRWPVMA